MSAATASGCSGPRDGRAPAAPVTPSAANIPATYVAPSMAKANEAPATPTRAPATAGPMIWASDRLASSLAFPSISAGAGRSSGTKLCRARSNCSEATLTTSTITMRWVMRSTPLAARADSTNSSTARTPLVTTITRRGSSRSTIAPATNPSTMIGTNSTAVRTPMPSVEAPRVVTAASGMATAEIWVPTRETDSPR